MPRPSVLVTSALLLLLSVLLVALPALGKDEKKPKFPKWKSGIQEGVVTIDGKEEAFTVLVPKRFSSKKKHPAVFLLHGNGGKAKSFLTSVKSSAGKKPPLLISLERCDNNQDAVGYLPKYMAQLAEQFNLDEDKLFCLGFSGGGFRLWDDVVCKEKELVKFRGIVMVGSAKQSFEPPDKPKDAPRLPTVILVGDLKDRNYTEPGPAAKKLLEAKGYEVIEHQHSSGHSMPAKQMKAVFEWIAKAIKAKAAKKSSPANPSSKKSGSSAGD